MGTERIRFYGHQITHLEKDSQMKSYNETISNIYSKMEQYETVGPTFSDCNKIHFILGVCTQRHFPVLSVDEYRRFS